MTFITLFCRLSAISALLILVAACDPTPSSQPAVPVPQFTPAIPTTNATIPPEPEAKPVVEQEPESLSLSKGQTEGDVKTLLGPPSGFVSISNRTTLLYSGVALHFENGKLTAPYPDILKQIKLKQDELSSFEINSDTESQTAGIQQDDPASLAVNSDTKFKATGMKLLNLITSFNVAKEVVLKDRDGNVIDHSPLITKGKITVVDFYATWCGPCQQLAPILDSIVQGQSDVVLKKVDIGKWGSPITKQYDVYTVPNIRVFDKQGRLVAQPAP
ncbi:MAG: thioredoxin family protein, partial [Kiritimatiellaceae bacterium]|nr:thioredoxin family protein [Kiritimatiellaceae bacterium]